MSYDLSSYSGLKTAIANLLNRDDLTDYVDGFIDMFEADMNNDLRVIWMETTTDLTPDADGFITLPSNFLNARQLRAKTAYAVNLTPSTLDYVDSAVPDREAAQPRYYAVMNGKILILPRTTADIELTYWQEIPALSDSTTTNWLLEKSPQMYLYGAALHSAPFLHDDQRISIWGQLLEVAKDKLERRSRKMKFGAGVSRIKGPTP